MISSILHWVLTKTNISYDDALRSIPMCTLFLLLRQEQYVATDGKGIHLSDIEMIDSMKQFK